MKDRKFRSDRVVDSTNNNEYAQDMRDETLWDDDLVDVDIPLSERIPEPADETPDERRPIYNEQDYRHNTL